MLMESFRLDPQGHECSFIQPQKSGMQGVCGEGSSLHPVQVHPTIPAGCSLSGCVSSSHIPAIGQGQLVVLE